MNVYDYTNERLLLVKTSNPLLRKPSIMRRLNAALEGARQGYARSAVNALPDVSPAIQAIASRPPQRGFLPEFTKKRDFLRVPLLGMAGLLAADAAFDPNLYDLTREYLYY